MTGEAVFGAGHGKKILIIVITSTYFKTAWGVIVCLFILASFCVSHKSDWSHLYIYLIYLKNILLIKNKVVTVFEPYSVTKPLLQVRNMTYVRAVLLMQELTLLCGGVAGLKPRVRGHRVRPVSLSCGDLRVFCSTHRETAELNKKTLMCVMSKSLKFWRNEWNYSICLKPSTEYRQV